MGERKLAAVEAVAAACQEGVAAMAGPSDEPMRMQTPGGVFSARWDERGSATALGQLAFFAEYLEATGLFEHWLKRSRMKRRHRSRGSSSMFAPV